jgi:alkyldihydroxyacetonephosphate synthase
LILHESDHVVEVEAGRSMSEVEAYCVAKGFSMRLEAIPDMPVAAWLSEGAPGSRSPFLDPADHLIAGLHGVLKNGKPIRIPPCPRRAAGPDMVSLFQGQWGRFGSIERVWLRVHAKDASAPTFPLARDTNPKLTSMEEVMLLILEKELS